MNKKLIKTIASISCGLGIISSIPFAATSCGSSSDVVPKNALPYDVYAIQNNILLGFKDGIDLSKYENICDTMQIPSKVTSIAANAFYNSSVSTIPSFIENLTFAESSNCSSIDSSAFYNFNSLVSLRLPSSLISIDTYAFYYCSSLTSIILTDNLTKIGSHSFEGCSSLTSISFPESLTEIDIAAFKSCSRLRSVDLSKCTELKTLSSESFSSCQLLTSINLSSTIIKSIGAHCFEMCYALTSVTFPSSLIAISDFAFLSDSALTTVDFSNCINLSSIGAKAFVRTTALTSIDLSNCVNLSSIGEQAFSMSNLTFIDLLNCINLSSIGAYAFSSNASGISKLTSIKLSGKKLSSIGEKAFLYCSNFNEIVWDAWQGPLDQPLVSSTFSTVKNTGNVTVTNPIDDAHNSDALLQYLKQYGGLPSGWSVA